MSNIIKTDWLRVLCLGFLSFLFGIPLWCFILTWSSTDLYRKQFSIAHKTARNPFEVRSIASISIRLTQNVTTLPPTYSMRAARIYTIIILASSNLCSFLAAYTHLYNAPINPRVGSYTYNRHTHTHKAHTQSLSAKINASRVAPHIDKNHIYVYIALAHIFAHNSLCSSTLETSFGALLQWNPSPSKRIHTKHTHPHMVLARVCLYTNIWCSYNWIHFRRCTKDYTTTACFRSWRIHLSPENGTSKTIPFLGAQRARQN